MKLSKKTFIFLALIIILAALLRLFNLADIPPSLYTDEANQGYNAYSIMLTGKDEHGTFLPVSLRSFGDWKPPLPTYLMIPFIYLLGLNEIAVRLPSAILGVGTVILTYYLVKELFKREKEANLLAFLSAFFLSISPWHILQSRSAMLVVVALFFLELGIFLFIKGIKNPKFFIFSSVSFVLSIYSYYGLRVVTPLMVFFLLINYREELKFFRHELIKAFLIGMFIISPLLIAFIKQPDVIFGRAKTVSIFYDQGVKLRQWELITQDGLNTSPLLTRFFHNNLYMYGISIIRRFLSHFDGRYLFLLGDQSLPFQIPHMGILYLFDSFLIVLGLLYLYYKHSLNTRNLINFWFLVSFIPAAFTFMTPSSNRTFNAVIPFTIFNSLGVICLLEWVKVKKHKYHTTVYGSCAERTSFVKKIIIGLAISSVYAISFGYFLQQYFINLPSNHADWWNYGWRQTVEYIKKIEGNYKNVVVPEFFGMPYIYYLFYNQYPPSRYQQSVIRTYISDQFGYEHVEGFGKYLFLSENEWEKIKINKFTNTIYVIPQREMLNDVELKKIIYYPNGREVFKIYVTP